MTDKDFLQKPQGFIALMVITSLISGLVGGFIGTKLSISPASLPKTVEQRTYIEESQSIDAIKKVSSAVVSIVATRDLKVYYNSPYPFLNSLNGNDPFGNFPGIQFNVPQQNPNGNQGQEGKDYEIRQQKIGGGSGFVIADDGLVLTNRHVVSNKSLEYTIITNDGTEYDAEVVSIDSLNDLGVLQMVKKGELTKKKEERTKLAGLKTVELGDSDKLEVGQKVLAIGYALGQYQNTVTSGIISAKGREITANDGGRGAETLSGLLQTDAAINPGNSGGPLINLAGQMVGVNVAIDVTGSSIGFAIPVNEVKPVLESIKKFGRIVRASLGVRYMILNQEQAKELKLDVDHGALLVGDESKGQFAIIPGSAAEKSGLKVKDVILAINGKDINLDYMLQDSIREHKPGDELTLKIWRSGKVMDIKVKLEEGKDEAAALRAKA